MAERPYLEIVDGELAGAHFVLLADRLVIGRAGDCDVCLENVTGVSRRHAELRLEPGGEAILTDLGSHNGTLVDGQRVTETRLAPGQTFRIGAVALRLMRPAADAPSPAAAIVPPPAAKDGRHAPAEATIALDANGLAALAAANGTAVAVGAPSSSPVPATGGGGVATLDAESLLQAASGGAGRGLWSILLVVALVLALGYGAKALTREGPARGPYTRIVERRERRVIFTQRPFSSFRALPYGIDTGEGEPIAVAEFDGMLKDAIREFNEETVAARQPGRALYFLVVIGAADTRDEPAWIELGGDGGVERIPVVVRGLRARPGMLAAMPAGERRGEIARRRASAVTMEADGHLYYALQDLDAAVELARVENDTATLAECQQSRMRVRGLLSQKLREGYLAAMREAFPDARGTRRANYADGYRRLVELKRLVPDENNPDWQALDICQAWMRRRYLASRR